MLKLTWILTIIFALQVKADNLYSQITKIDINASNMSLEEIIWEIKNQTEFDFFYSNDDIKDVKALNFNLKHASIDEILVKILKETNLEYQVVNKTVIIKKAINNNLKKNETDSELESQSQEIIIKGKVVDSDGNPLPGVNVVEKGTTNGTVTDLNGSYSINVATLNAALSFSFIGYLTEEIETTGQTTIDVILIEDIQSLEEAVVVGYGVQKKESVVAAISSIKADEILQSPSSNIGVALAGRLPGLTVLQRSGEPGGEGIELYIRGRSTLNEQQPLLMVDGVERDFNALDPHEIETITILKDASATAVYGVRGANGVILVTTKRGKIGKPSIDITAEQSMQTPTRLPDMVSAYDYAVLSNQVELQKGNTPIYSDFELERYLRADSTSVYPVRDFVDEFTKNFSPMTKVNINISGGTQKMRYFTTVGLMSQKGLFETENFDEYNYDAESKANRVNFRSNFDIELNKSLKMWLNIGGYMEKKNDPIVLSGASGSNTYYLVMAKLLSTPNLAYNDLSPDGEVMGSTRYAVGGATQTPYGYLNRSGFKLATSNNVMTTLGAEQKLDFIVKGLSAKIVASYDAYTVNEQRRKREYAVYEFAGVINDSLTYTKLGATNNTPLVDEQAQSFSTLFNVDASLNYVQTFGVHDITGLFLVNRYQRIENIDLPYNYIGIVGRATYSYNRKYLAEVNFGYNGSEQFAPGKQFGFFPSFSLGWVLSEESFLSNSNIIDFWKLRMSYGRVGNDRMGSSRFLYIDDWGTGSAWSGLTSGTYENTMANKNISWEINNKYNVGTELRFLDGFRLDLDAFYEVRNNILIRESGTTPTYMFGQSNLPPANYGEVENKGFEVAFGYQKQISSDLMILGQVNTAYNHNNIKYVNEVTLGEDYAHQYRETGYRIGEYWGYKTDGFFNSQGEIDNWYDQTALGAAPQPGDIKYVDQNGDNIIDEKDIVPIGNPNIPELTFGGAINIIYKNFDVSCMFQGAARRSYYLNSRGTWETAGNFTEWHKEAWTQEKYATGEEINYPRLVPGGNSNHMANDFWVVDGSYIRLKNAELGYTLSSNLSQKIGASKVRIYINGFNLLTFDKFPKKYFDPEQSNQLSHPLFRVYNTGLNITF